MAEAMVIANPIAGRGAGTRLTPHILELLKGYGLKPELSWTAAPGHATSLACEAVRQGFRTVVAVGGDGTANEVLNGLMQANGGVTDTALAVIPIGTGNDFAFSAGLPMNLVQACQVAARGQSRWIDVGWVQADNEPSRYFGNGVGIGFDAIVNIESRKLRKLRGFLVYLIAVLKTLVTYYHAPQTVVRVDDREMVQPSLMISIMNGYRFGGGFYMTPGARMDDGLLDLCVAGKVDRLRMLGFVPQFMHGTHTKDVHITMTQGCQVCVESDSPWASHVDGEIYGVGGRRYLVKLFPRRLRLIS